jgi:enoyl-CoA hydratase/carnithine racemase
MILREDHDSVALLRMEYGKVNAIDIELFSELERKLTDVEQSSVSAVVLTGTGKAFSAGVDLFKVLDGGRPYLTKFLPLLVKVLEKIFLFRKPVVAAVNGHAIAGGCLLACASNYRIAAKGNATIGVPELLVGVPFPPLALEIVRASVSPQRLQEIVYTGHCYPMEEALQCGMIDEVVDSERLLARAKEMAAQLGRIPPRSFSMAKHQMRQPYIDYVRKYGNSDEATLDEWSSPATHEVIRNYLQKTIGKK